MREPGFPSLDQLRVFVTVIDAGGFANAARQLHRTQSVISYTIANLEEQLNVVLLDRSTRKPVLTEAGRALLADARAVSMKVDGMRARARALAGGLEAEVSLAVDVMFPTSELLGVLEAFSLEFPTVALRLRTEALGAVTQLVLDRVCHVGIGGWVITATDAIERQATGHVRLLAVAAPGHPLAQVKGAIPTSLAREHTQLVLTDRSTLTAGQDFGVLALRDWRLGDLGSKHALLRAGLGWGSMPEATVREDLAEGRLVRLQMGEGGLMHYPVHAMRRADAQPGQAATWLLQRFAELLPGLLERGY
jgi:DNA-binding transcriptional LysR family regulator